MWDAHLLAETDWAAFYNELYGDSDTTDSIPHHPERLVEMLIV